MRNAMKLGLVAAVFAALLVGGCKPKTTNNNDNSGGPRTAAQLQGVACRLHTVEECPLTPTCGIGADGNCELKNLNLDCNGYDGNSVACNKVTGCFYSVKSGNKCQDALDSSVSACAAGDEKPEQCVAIKPETNATNTGCKFADDTKKCTDAACADLDATQCGVAILAGANCQVNATDTTKCEDKPTPPTFTSAKEIAAIETNVCAVTNLDTVTCWPAIVGTAAATDTVGNGTRVFAAPADKVKGIVAGEKHFCAIKTADNFPVCWGTLPNTMKVNLGATGGVSQVAAGTSFGCYILAADKKAHCDGSADVNFVDKGITSDTEAAQNFSALTFSSIYAGAGHACGILDTATSTTTIGSYTPVAGDMVCVGATNTDKVATPIGKATLSTGTRILALGASFVAHIANDGKALLIGPATVKGLDVAAEKQGVAIAADHSNVVMTSVFGSSPVAGFCAIGNDALVYCTQGVDIKLETFIPNAPSSLAVASTLVCAINGAGDATKVQGKVVCQGKVATDPRVSGIPASLKVVP